MGPSPYELLLGSLAACELYGLQGTVSHEVVRKELPLTGGFIQAEAGLSCGIDENIVIDPVGIQRGLHEHRTVQDRVRVEDKIARDPCVDDVKVQPDGIAAQRISNKIFLGKENYGKMSDCCNFCKYWHFLLRK